MTENEKDPTGLIAEVRNLVASYDREIAGAAEDLARRRSNLLNLHTQRRKWAVKLAQATGEDIPPEPPEDAVDASIAAAGVASAEAPVVAKSPRLDKAPRRKRASRS